MPLVTSSVADRATNTGAAGMGASTFVEHDEKPTAVSARIRMRKDLGIEKR